MWRVSGGGARAVLLSAVLLLAWALMWSGPGWAGSTVTGVRIGKHPHTTRFVLDLTDPVEHSIFVLADPYRVVIDLPEVAWEVPAEKNAKGTGVIKGYRYGLFRPGTWRIVLDAAAPVRTKRAFLLEPRDGHRYRLVLDLEQVSREAFLREIESRPPRATAALMPRPKPPGPVRPPGKRVVVLDPGHGGVDPGARGRSGVLEKTITLAIAREVKRQLEATDRYHVVLTRDRDIFLRLRERVAVARRAGADLFLSLHADTIDNRKVRGLSVYTLSEKASDAEAESLAAQENKADIIAGIDLSDEPAEVTDILIDLAQRETMNLSAHLAKFLIRELRRDVRLLHKSHRFAGFAVLKAPDVPSALVELGYLSNREEERLLRDPAYRSRLANAVLKAVDRYFSWQEVLTRS
jgi:N-acetylmuramoyl-L-alanine amidase